MSAVSFGMEQPGARTSRFPACSTAVCHWLRRAAGESFRKFTSSSPASNSPEYCRRTSVMPTPVEWRGIHGLQDHPVKGLAELGIVGFAENSILSVGDGQEDSGRTCRHGFLG